jgi:hypothetical protein
MRGADLSDSRNAADYIATITGELAEMAALQGWGTLVGVLQRARLEGEQVRDCIYPSDEESAESDSLADHGPVDGYGEN